MKWIDNNNNDDDKYNNNRHISIEIINSEKTETTWDGIDYNIKQINNINQKLFSFKFKHCSF